MRRALTLRGTLRLLGLGAMAYVAIIAVVPSIAAAILSATRTSAR